MTVTTGMLMAGKMSTVMVTMDTTPRTAMSRARTTNVYGRRRASRTIHMACGRLHASCRATPVVGMEAARAVAGLLTAAEQWVQCGASFAERRLDHGARSSDGAPAASQSQNCTEAAVSLHSVRTSWAMARNAPVEAVWLERQRSSSQASKASGSGSARTACSRSWRLSDIPMASGVVSRLRRPRLPSDASRAASNARQAPAGRKRVMALPGRPRAQSKQCPQPRRAGYDLYLSSFRGRPAIATLERDDIQDQCGKIVQEHVLRTDRHQGGDGLDVVAASLADVDRLRLRSL